MIDPKDLTKIVDAVMALDIEELKELRGVAQSMYERAVANQSATTGFVVTIMGMSLASIDALISYRESLEEIAAPMRESLGAVYGF